MLYFRYYFIFIYVYWCSIRFPYHWCNTTSITTWTATLLTLLEFTPGFSSFFFFFLFFFFMESCYSILVVSAMFCRSFCLSTLFLLAIVFYVLRFAASGYKFDTFKLLFGLIFYLYSLGILWMTSVLSNKIWRILIK